MQNHLIESVFERPSLVFESNRPWIIVGAGELAQKTYLALTEAGYEVSGFAADWPNPKLNIEVLSFEKAVETYPNHHYVVAIWRPDHSFLKTKERFLKLGIQKIFSFVELGLTIIPNLFPFYMFSSFDNLLKEKNRLKEIYDRLQDSESQNHFLAALKLRLFGEFKNFEMKSEYFHDFIQNELPQNPSFLDGGAFDGDTISDFLKTFNGKFSKIWAFEPDPINFGKLQKQVNSLTTSEREKISLYSMALSNDLNPVSFSHLGQLSSHRSNSDQKVPTETLDHLFKSNSATPDLIKLDVEGDEMNTLLGAQRLLQESSSTWIICAYHRPSDFWEIPEFLFKWRPNAALRFRVSKPDGITSAFYLSSSP